MHRGPPRRSGKVTLYQHDKPMPSLTDFRVTHLRQLEAESIYILREVAADLRGP